jgi:hypothetical protein
MTGMPVIYIRFLFEPAMWLFCKGGSNGNFFIDSFDVGFINKRLRKAVDLGKPVDYLEIFLYHMKYRMQLKRQGGGTVWKH